jgi:transmembrane sensor
MGGRLVRAGRDRTAAEARAEAAVWLARLHADTRSAADDRAFQDWLRASHHNEAAFEALTLVWDAAGGLGGMPGVSVPRRGPARLGRRSVLAGIGALVAAGAGMGVWQSAYAGVYKTDVGEQKHVQLSDGTLVFLDTDTRIRELYDSEVRKVDLDRGRANFNVAADKRPFIVEAGAEEIVAGQTTFDVRRIGGQVSFVLIRGRATVPLRSPAGDQARKVLGAGERVVVSDTGETHLDKPNLAPLLAWQMGQAVFDNEPLRDAIAEMNRYSVTKLVIEDPAIASLRLSGVYRVGDNRAFARSVAVVLPVALRSDGDSLELERDPSRMPIY